LRKQHLDHERLAADREQQLHDHRLHVDQVDLDDVEHFDHHQHHHDAHDHNHDRVVERQRDRRHVARERRRARGSGRIRRQRRQASAGWPVVPGQLLRLSVGAAQPATKYAQ
jgi:hypothetical protein